MKTLVTNFVDIQLDDAFGGVTTHRGSRHTDYHYAYMGAKEVKAGDWALVHNGTEFGLVRVKRVLAGMSAKVKKVVMLAFTQEDFQDYLKMNDQLAARADAFNQLDEMLAEKKKMAKYEELKDNEQAQSLLAFITSFGQNTIEEQANTLTAASSSDEVVS